MHEFLKDMTIFPEEIITFVQSFVIDKKHI
ncbi:hypothetical protein M2137_000840 [Parabacteroides sp. PFB2-10]|nr:hypothetical protein [Parabacteroides sp. PFB2-10]